MNKTYSVCNVVRDETLHLFERVTIAGREIFVPFDQRILWLRESRTQVVLRWDGETFDKKTTLNDYYGYLCSLEEAIKVDAPKWVKALKLTKDDRLSVDLDVTITDQAVLECNDREAKADAVTYAGKKYRKAYFCVPTWRDGKYWYTSDVPAPVPAGADQRLEPMFDRHPRFAHEIEYYAKQAFYSTRDYPVGEMPADLAQWIAIERAKVEG